MNRHDGDVTLLKGDENGKAKITRVDKYITLYGNRSPYGRMADMHFPKGCAYPDGWESQLNDLGNLIGDS